MDTTLIKYEAMEFHRGIVVMQMPAREVEADGFPDLASASRFAEQMNQWYKNKPNPDPTAAVLTFNAVAGILGSEPTYADLERSLDKLLLAETAAVSIHPEN